MTVVRLVAKRNSFIIHCDPGGNLTSCGYVAIGSDTGEGPWEEVSSHGSLWSVSCRRCRRCLVSIGDLPKDAL